MLNFLGCIDRFFETFFKYCLKRFFYYKVTFFLLNNYETDRMICFIKELLSRLIFNGQNMSAL